METTHLGEDLEFSDLLTTKSFLVGVKFDSSDDVLIGENECRASARTLLTVGGRVVIVLHGAVAPFRGIGH
jgi:hypothetical protein